MPNPDQIDIRQHKPGEFTVEADFQADWISWLKTRVPAHFRSYDPETKIWTIDAQFMSAVEGIAAQKFLYAVKWYRNGNGELVMKNLKTGVEQVQAKLF